MNNKEGPQEKPKKILDICYFKVPVVITEDAEGNKVANFKEVDMKDLCFKIEEIETETAQEAMSQLQKLSSINNIELKLSAKTNKDGDIITRVIACDHGKVQVTINQ